MKKSNNQAAYSLRGIVKKSRKSKGFFIDDTKYDSQFKLGKKELYKAMPGDLVQFSLTQKGWAKIQRVITSNTTEFIGKVFKRGKRLYTSPIGFEHDLKIIVRDRKVGKIEEGYFGKFTILKQPSEENLAEAELEMVFDSEDIFSLAYEMAVTNHNIKRDWPKSVVNEIKQLKNKSFDDKRLEDLRDKVFVTIDGKNAKDFDDAVLGETDKEGNLILYVAIADVSRYVEMGTSLDHEAFERGTSTYFSQRVIPMLPEVLSNDLCSLKPNEDRFCLVCKTKVDIEGNLSDTTFFEAVINSKARLTYGTVSREMEKNQFKRPYEKSLNTLVKIYKRLKKNRIARSSLELEVPTYSPKIENEKITKFIDSSRDDSHMMIEEFMLAANISAAKICIKQDVPSLYRIHPKPDITKIKAVETFLRTRQINASFEDGSDIKKIASIIDLVKDRRDKKIIHSQILFSMSLATYEAEVSEHYALNYTSYTHFTSPIRRYPDLVVHRVIKSLIKEKGGPVSLSDKQLIMDRIYLEDDLIEVASQCSARERTAEAAEREALNILKCSFAESLIGNTYKGQIVGVTNFGLFIHLQDINIEGLCHIKYLPRNEYYVFDEDSKMLQSNSSRHSYSLGDYVKVNIEKVETFGQKIDLRIVS